MLVVREYSDLPMNEIVDSFETKAKERGFVVLHSYNYHEILKEKGFPIERKAIIYEICQAKMAAMMLEKHPEFSPFMPCRVSIYEDGGKSVLAAQNMEPLFDMLEDNSLLKAEAKRLFESMKELLNALKNK